MDYTSLPITQNFEEADTNPSFSAPLSTGFRAHLLEYASMATLFVKLYYQNRLIAAQNFILSCKLQAWAVVFFTFKVQIFFTRLAYGFPVNRCWPRG
jgi:hypothetical protein